MNKISTLRNIHPQRLIFATLIFLLILLLSLGFVVPALTQAFEDGNVFTGCVNQNSGTLRNVAVGSEPAKECNEEEFQITWDHAEPAFESRIAALEERMAELEEPFGTLELYVDCDAGDTIGDALAEAQTHAGPVNLTISGICEENVWVERDDVSFVGTQAGDGIRGSSTGSYPAVFLYFAHRVRFSNLTLSGGITNMLVRGASFEASDVIFRDSRDNGIVAIDGSVGVIRGSAILGHPVFAVSADTESIIDIENCEITDNGHIGLFAGGVGSGTIWVRDSHIARNLTGVAANTGGNVRIQSSTIEQNSQAGVVAFGGEIVVHGEDSETLIANNGAGIQFVNGASGFLVNVIIDNNDYQGVHLSGGSNVTILDTIVSNNRAGGIWVGDLSTISIPPEGVGTQIIDNVGWGIYCGGPPAIAVLGGQGLFDPSEILFSGNTMGDTNCQ